MKKIDSMFKRILPLILALALFLGAAPPASAFADGSGYIPPEPFSSGFDSGDFVQDEVYALADSQERAEEIASMYGLELKSYAYRIAVFSAKDPEKMKDISKAAARSFILSDFDLPALSLNYITGIYDEGYEDDIYDDETAADKHDASSIYGAGISSAPVGTNQWHHKVMDNERAWEITKGEGVVVAIVDTGIDVTHPKFAGRILPEYAYNSHTLETGISSVKDDQGHGTHVAGIVAASMDGDAAVCGVAPDVNLIIVKANRPYDASRFDDVSWLRGIGHAVESGADIINISIERYTSNPDEIGAITDVMAKAAQAGVTVVCAAGNQGYSYAAYPARYSEAIAVSALKEDASGVQGAVFDNAYSNYGQEIALSAPGTWVNSTKNGGGNELRRGTSMSSPNVAGAAALIKSVRPDYTPAQIREVLCKTAADAGAAGRDNYYGYGIVNSYAALLAIEDETEKTGVTVSGTVAAYCPSFETTVTLKQESSIIEEKNLEAAGGTGLVTQQFSFDNVTPGTYSIVIEKAGHLRHTKSTVTVGESDCDTGTVTLLAGAIRDLSQITLLDLLTLVEYYEKPVTNETSRIANFTGNGTVNLLDLFKIVDNYEKREIKEP